MNCLAPVNHIAIKQSVKKLQRDIDILAVYPHYLEDIHEIGEELKCGTSEYTCPPRNKVIPKCDIEPQSRRIFNRKSANNFNLPTI